MSQRLRIQDALVSLVLGTDWPVVSYDEDGRPSGLDMAEKEQPQTPILCNEISSSFDLDEQNLRGDFQRRTSWIFSLKIKFDREVLLEYFENAMMANPLYLGPDLSRGLSSVTLRLIGTEPTHPVQKGGPGTSVEFSFEAEQGRR